MQVPPTRPGQLDPVRPLEKRLGGWIRPSARTHARTRGSDRGIKKVEKLCFADGL